MAKCFSVKRIYENMRRDGQIGSACQSQSLQGAKHMGGGLPNGECPDALNK